MKDCQTTTLCCMPMQVLQPLSIFIQNIKSPTAVFYLFSNNHLNDIVGLHFDFEDDEVLGYYINLLKAISVKFDTSSVQFFFQVVPCERPGRCLLCRLRAAWAAPPAYSLLLSMLPSHVEAGVEALLSQLCSRIAHRSLQASKLVV